MSVKVQDVENYLNQERTKLHAWATVHPFVFAILLATVVGVAAHFIR